MFCMVYNFDGNSASIHQFALLWKAPVWREDGVGLELIG